MAEFDGASQTFLAWLKQAGAEISPKITLEDLRNKDAGRGVGKYLLQLRMLSDSL
jgi:SET domain-containing protein 6